MNYLKYFLLGGFILLLINFIVINILTLIFTFSDSIIDYQMTLFDLPLLNINVHDNSFGYVIMFGGIVVSFLLGGLLGSLFLFIFNKKSV